MKVIEVKTFFYTFVEYEIFITTYDVRVRSVNNLIFIFGSYFVFFSEEKTNSDSNMKLLLFTERTLCFFTLRNILGVVKYDGMIYV